MESTVANFKTNNKTKRKIRLLLIKKKIPRVQQCLLLETFPSPTRNDGIKQNDQWRNDITHIKTRVLLLASFPNGSSIVDPAAELRLLIVTFRARFTTGAAEVPRVRDDVAVKIRGIKVRWGLFGQTPVEGAPILAAHRPR